MKWQPLRVTSVVARGAGGHPLGIAGAPGRTGYPITTVPFSSVRLTDAFWTSRVETNRTVTIPFGFRKSEEEGRLRNFEHAARHDGPFEGKMPFDDTDVYKLIEGASYSLQSHPDPELDKYLDGIISKIAAAQEPDGYLTTYKTIDPTKSPATWLKPGPEVGPRAPGQPRAVQRRAPVRGGVRALPRHRQAHACSTWPCGTRTWSHAPSGRASV